MGRKRVFETFVLIMAVLLATAGLAARPTDGIAIGAQVGFAATGVVVDIPLGGLYLNAGLNTPLLWTYIAANAGADDNLMAPFFTVTADLTKPFPLGENFDLKVGLSALGATDFETVLVGIVGPTVKGEYWIPNKDMGLFMHMDVPVAYYMVSETENFFGTNWLVPLFGLVTTTAGVLWAL